MDDILIRILECMGNHHGAGKELADYLGISPNVITNWKNGSNRSYRRYLEQIAAKYGVSVDYLKYGLKTEKPATKSGDEPHKIPGYDKLTPANRAAIDQLIENLLKSQSDE